MRFVLPASLLVATLALTGCVASESDRLAASARDTVASLQALSDDERLSAVLALAAANERAARDDWGIDDALDGTTAADSIFDDLHALLAERSEDASPDRRGRPRSAPAGVDSAPAPTGFDTMIGTGFIAIEWIGTRGLDAADRGESGSEVEEGGGTRIETTVSENGDVSATYSTEVSQDGSSASISAGTELQPCPDADGRLEVTGTTRVRFSSGKATLDISLEVTARATLDDDAQYASSEHDYRYQIAATIGGKGEFFDHSGNSGGELTINRSSSATSFEFQQSAVDAAAALAEMVASDLYLTAKRGWESGRCVTIDVTASADEQNLEPSSETEIEVSPRSTRDGKPTGGSVVTTHSGQGSIDRDGSKVAAVATYTYTASDEKNMFGTLTIESRSKRGVGTTTFSVGTGGRAYTAVGSDGEFHGTGTICSLTETFTFGGSGLEFVFTPVDQAGGTFRMTGSVDGVGFTGDGTYTVNWADSSLATSILVDGDIVLTTAEGVTTTSPTDLTIVLTPTDSCS